MEVNINKIEKQNKTKIKPNEKKVKEKPKFRGSYKIKRVYHGRSKRIYNIELKSLSPFERNFLLNNPLLKYSNLTENDQFILILLRIVDNTRYLKKYDKYYNNPFTNTINTLIEIKKSSKQTDWKCAICNKPIRSTIGEFNIENFLCSICIKTHSKTQMVDGRIVSSSIKFRKKCEQLYKQQQEIFKKFIRNSI